jgi:SAM-dependent methyltransferase
VSNIKGKNMEIFKDYAYYYNAFYKDKDYKIEAAQVDTLLKKYGRDIRTLIDFGCGTGKHDLELVKLGYQCRGIDLSPLMVELAKKNTIQEKLEIDFSEEDIRNYKSSSMYDAVISLFHVISYQNKNKDVLNTFHSARRVLKKGGIFLFDVWYGPGVLSDKPSIRVKEIEDENNRLLRVATPIIHENENVVDVHYKIFVINKKTNQTQIITEIHNMRYFFKPELELMLEETGFTLLDNLDCHTLQTTNYSSWTSYFIAMAI